MTLARARSGVLALRGASRWLPGTTSVNARVLLLCSWVVTAASVALNAVTRLGTVDSTDRLLAAAGVVVFAGAAGMFARLQLRVVQGRADQRQTWELLALGLVPLAWGSPSEPLAFGVAAALVCLPAGRAIPVLATTGAVFFLLFPEGGGLTGGSAGAAVVQLLVIGLMFGVITQLAVTLDRLQRAREQLLRNGVERERERVAHDLHDLMGRTLVTASLRCETLLRCVDGDGDPELRARIGGLRDTLAQGQSRVRALTSGPITSSWADEIESARALCARLGIEFALIGDEDLLDGHAPLAALLVRESLTTAVSDPRTGRIEVVLDRRPDGAAAVRVTHDGHDPRAGPPETPDRLVAAVGRAGGQIAVSTERGTWTADLRLPIGSGARAEGP